jgi:hypothetical protein
MGEEPRTSENKEPSVSRSDRTHHPIVVPAEVRGSLTPSLISTERRTMIAGTYSSKYPSSDSIRLNWPC